MAKKLKLTVMVHIEDTMFYNAVEASRMALLATRVTNQLAGGTARGAQMTWQFDVNYFKSNAEPLGTYPLDDGDPTSLSYLLDCGHNWWIQNHCVTFEHLHTTRTRITSAYAMESGGAPITPIGRSGGSDTSGTDWVSIAWHEGLKAKNSTVQQNYGMSPETLRPMLYSDDEINKLRRHQRAPGTTNYACPSTMQFRATQCPFWTDSASYFDKLADSIYPEQSGRMLVIPNNTNDGLDRMLEGHTAYTDFDLTTENCNAAITQIHTTYSNMMHKGLESIVNVWYAALPPQYIWGTGFLDYHNLICAWVDSVNEVMDVHHAFPDSRKAEWMNMDQITSMAFDSTSKYW